MRRGSFFRQLENYKYFIKKLLKLKESLIAKLKGRKMPQEKVIQRHTVIKLLNFKDKESFESYAKILSHLPRKK